MLRPVLFQQPSATGGSENLIRAVCEKGSSRGKKNDKNVTRLEARRKRKVRGVRFHPRPISLDIKTMFKQMTGVWCPIQQRKFTLRRNRFFSLKYLGTRGISARPPFLFKRIQCMSADNVNYGSRVTMLSTGYTREQNSMRRVVSIYRVQVYS